MGIAAWLLLLQIYFEHRLSNLLRLAEPGCFLAPMTSIEQQQQARSGFLKRYQQRAFDAQRKAARERTARWRTKNKQLRRPDAYAAGTAMLAAYATLDHYTAADSEIVKRWLEILAQHGYDWTETHKLIKTIRRRLKLADQPENPTAPRSDVS